MDPILDQWASLFLSKIILTSEGFLVATRDGNKFSGSTLTDALQAAMNAMPLPVDEPPVITEEPAP